jgi:hypothetical protein
MSWKRKWPKPAMSPGRRALPKNRRRRKANEQVSLAECAPTHEQPKSRTNCVAGADSPFKHPGWLYWAAAECLSTSAAARLAAWRCSPRSGMRHRVTVVPINRLRVRYRDHSCRAHQQSSRQLMTQLGHSSDRGAIPSVTGRRADKSGL